MHITHKEHKDENNHSSLILQYILLNYFFLNKKYIPQNPEEIKQPKWTPTDCSQVLNIKALSISRFLSAVAHFKLLFLHILLPYQ